ncbi:MAG: hypothetical protein AB7T31_07895 [Gemmatimonadales bacterium]
MNYKASRAFGALTVALLTAALPGSASSQSALDAADAQAFLGSWTLAMTSQMGNFNMGLSLTNMSGKVGAVLDFPDAGMNQEITDISKSGESLVLSFVGEAQGQTFDAVVTLEPTGPSTVDVYFDIAAGAFAMTGTGTKAAS